MTFLKKILAIGTLLMTGCMAWADINVGVILSLTGPGASLGIPEEKIIQLWPGELGGQKVKFTVLNDNTDTSTAAKNTMRLILEDKVDLIIGSSVTPTSLAVVEAAGAQKVPVISLAGGGAIVRGNPPKPGENPRIVPRSSIGASSRFMVGKMSAINSATISIANSYGDGFLKAVETITAAKGVKLTASEKYNLTDPSVTSQVLKVLASNPDAVYILSLIHI